MPTAHPTSRTALGVELLEDREVPASFGTNGGLSVQQVFGLLNQPVNPNTGSGLSVTVTGTGPGVRDQVRIWTGDVGAANNGGGGGGGTTSIPTGRLLYSFYPFGNDTHGVYVATGDFNGDGKQDLAVSTAKGAVGRVKIYTFQGGGIQVLANFTPFGPNYTGGVEIAQQSARSFVTGTYPDPSGNPDPFDATRVPPAQAPQQLVVGTQSGAGVVKVFGFDPTQNPTNGPNFGGDFFQLRKFTPFGADYTGGVSLAVGNVDAQMVDTTGTIDLIDQYNYDYAEVIVARASGLPQIQVWDVQDPTPVLRSQWMAFDPSIPANRHGLNIVAGNTDANAANRTDWYGNEAPVVEIYANLKSTSIVRGFYGNSSAAFATVQVFPTGTSRMLNMSVRGVDNGITADLVIVAADGSYVQRPIYYSGGNSSPALLNGKKTL